MLAKELIPLLNQAGAGSLMKIDAYATIANQLLTSLDLNPSDYLEDHQTEEFLQKAQKQLKQKEEDAAKMKAIAEAKAKSEQAQAESNVRYTDIQADNAYQDNARQLAIAIDTHFQKWADMGMKANKDEVEVPEAPDFNNLVAMSKEILQGLSTKPAAPVAPGPSQPRVASPAMGQPQE